MAHLLRDITNKFNISRKKNFISHKQNHLSFERKHVDIFARCIMYIWKALNQQIHSNMNFKICFNTRFVSVYGFIVVFITKNLPTEVSKGQNLIFETFYWYGNRKINKEFNISSTSSCMLVRCKMCSRGIFGFTLICRKVLAYRQIWYNAYYI